MFDSHTIRCVIYRSSIRNCDYTLNYVTQSKDLICFSGVYWLNPTSNVSCVCLWVWAHVRWRRQTRDSIADTRERERGKKNWNHFWVLVHIFIRHQLQKITSDFVPSQRCQQQFASQLNNVKIFISFRQRRKTKTKNMYKISSSCDKPTSLSKFDANMLCISSEWKMEIFIGNRSHCAVSALCSMYKYQLAAHWQRKAATNKKKNW